MEITRALSQIAEIHAHPAKTEVFRGGRPIVVAATGILALVGGIVQGWFVGEISLIEFVHYWVAIAVLNVLFVAAEVGSNNLFCAGESLRRGRRDHRRPATLRSRAFH